MENMLSVFQSELSGISHEIKQLQGDSLAMNVKLRNRRALQSMTALGSPQGQGMPDETLRQLLQAMQQEMSALLNHINGMEILKQVLTQLLLYYTRLQKVIHKAFPQQPPAFARELVSNSTILYEIKQYSRSF